jgi:hypothetical protein
MLRLAETFRNGRQIDWLEIEILSPIHVQFSELE